MEPDPAGLAVTGTPPGNDTLMFRQELPPLGAMAERPRNLFKTLTGGGSLLASDILNASHLQINFPKI
jgi:hypothetical protein